MRPGKFILYALMLSVLTVSAFDISDYLYAGEEEKLTQETIEMGDITYNLYLISGNPTLLRMENEADDPLFISDKLLVEKILNKYYADKYLPTTEEWIDIHDNLIKLNDSRNVITMYTKPLGIEKTCLAITGLSISPCNDLDSCFMTATTMCSGYADGCDPSLVIDPIMHYSIHTQGLDQNMNKALSITKKNLEIDDAATKLGELKEALTGAKEHMAEIEESKLRYPKEGLSTCMDCVPICDYARYDYNALSKVENKINALESKLSPLKDISSFSELIIKSNADRESYKRGSALFGIWGPKWEEFKKENLILKENATINSIYISEPSFISNLNSFTSSWDAFEKKIAKRDFDKIADDFSRLQNLADNLKSTHSESMAYYSKSNLASQEAEYALIYAKLNVNTEDEASVDAFNMLIEKKNSLDSRLESSAMKNEQYDQLIQEYLVLAKEARVFVSSQRSLVDDSTSIGRNFSAMALQGVFGLTDALYEIPPSTRTQVAPLIPPVVLFLVDLAVASLTLVLFVGVLLKFKTIFRKKAFLGLWATLLFTFLFMLAIGSVGLFVFMDHSANSSSSLGRFVSELDESEQFYIAIDQTGVDEQTLSKMGSCANQLRTQLKDGWGKDVQIFTYSGEVCLLGDDEKLFTECLDEIGSNHAFYLHDGDEDYPTANFNIVYKKSADIYGGHSECLISKALRGAHPSELE
jgi:hypothetical protein